MSLILHLSFFLTITINYVISTFGSIYFTFSGEPGVNDQIASPVIATITLISKLKQIQEKILESSSLNPLKEISIYNKKSEMK